MLNKVSLTGFVENVEKQERLVYFTVPSTYGVMRMEMRFSQEIVDHIDQCFEKGQTIVSVEGVLGSENGNFSVIPTLVESYLIEKKPEAMA